MKKEVADRWVEALRSGKYEQGRRALRKGDTYCCLAVLCDISGISDWRHPEYGGNSEYDYVTDLLPRSVMDFAGMKSNGGDYSIENQSLAYQNDSGTDFHAIANIIEQNWQEL